MASTDGAVDVSHVCKLTRAARKQVFAKHDARAVELFGRAIAGAEALRQPDCLIVASLRSCRLEKLYRMTLSALSGDDSEVAQLCGASEILALFQVHLPGVLETLERRRTGDTLLPGHCRAHEEAWGADCVRSEAIWTGEQEPDEESLSQAGQHVGAGACFAAARIAVVASQTGLSLGIVPDEPLLDRCLNVVEHALLLMLGRQFIDSELPGRCIPSVELLFLSVFSEVLLPYLKPEEPRCARLLEAWQSLEQCGLLQELQVEKEREHFRRIDKSLAEAQAAKDAGVPLRACALPSCGAREAHVAHFKKCGACGQVVYCS